MAEKADPTSTPIYKLNVDTLWKIFWMNTDIFAAQDSSRRTDPNLPEYPMDDLRRTSQVCRFWREVALGSPVLWGEVIELDGLRRRIQWGRELVARAANAPLCIKATRRWEIDPECRHFFNEILDQHWCRIRKLDIIMHTPFREKVPGTGRTTLEPDIDPWEPLCRAAPLLESFSLVSYHPDSRILALVGSESPLFAHRAPRLHTFDLWAFRTPVVFTQTVLFQAPWLGQLRNLVLPPSLYPIEFLAALADMRLLESLIIRGTVRPVGSWDELEQHHTVILPLLQLLNMKATFHAAHLLLKCIQPSPVCSLALTVEGGHHIDHSPPILRDMAAQISRYVQAHLTQHHTVVIKELGITENTTTIHLGSLGRKSSSYVSITIHHAAGLPEPMMPHFLAPLLTSHQFTDINLFRLTFRSNLNGPVEEGISTVLSMLFSSLHSVSHMQITNEALQLMLRIPPDTQSVQIQTLELEDRPRSEGVSDFIIRFLTRQVGAGKPVGKFKLSPILSSGGDLPEQG